MASTKEILAQKLKQNTEKHQQAQREHIRDDKEFRRNIALKSIKKSPYQPRKIFNDTELQELADSISEIGLLQPITVRKIDNVTFELIAGERRLRAHELLNKLSIEVIVIDVTNHEASLLTLAENLKREDLTDYEVFIGLDALSSDLKKNKQKLAKSLGLNREDMYKYLSFEKLPQKILFDLNTAPNLLGRTAATAFKKFLADHIEHFEKAETALLQAWDNIKNKTLEQSKAVLYAEKLLKETSPKVNTFIERKINYSGKIAGHIKQNNNQLKVSMKVETLNDQQLEKLEKLLHEFLESPKKV